MYVYNISRPVTHGWNFSDKRSFIWLTVASLSPASCCRSDEHKSSVCIASVLEILWAWSVRYFRAICIPLEYNYRDGTNFASLSLESVECRAPSNVWIVFKSFASGDDLQRNQ